MARNRSTAEPEPRRRVIAYLRVSTDKQAARGVSLDAQRAKVHAYASLYELDLVAVEVDAGESASTLDRPALTRALARLDAHEADALLVVQLDRLTRSVRDLGDLLDRCNRRGWAILSVSDHLDTGSAAGRLAINIRASVAQWVWEDIGERTSAAMQYKAANGEYTGGHVPYGYCLADDGTHLEANPAEAEAVDLARDLRAAGLSLRAVAAELDRRGYRSRADRPFTPAAVARMAA